MVGKFVNESCTFIYNRSVLFLYISQSNEQIIDLRKRSSKSETTPKIQLIRGIVPKDPAILSRTGFLDIYAFNLITRTQNYFNIKYYNNKTIIVIKYNEQIGERFF